MSTYAGVFCAIVLFLAVTAKSCDLIPTLGPPWMHDAEEDFIEDVCRKALFGNTCEPVEISPWSTHVTVSPLANGTRTSEVWIKRRSAELRHIAGSLIRAPKYWKHYRGTHLPQHKGLHLVHVTPEVTKAIKSLVEKTWREDAVGIGIDAEKLKHRKIVVHNLQRIENPRLYYKYAAHRQEFCYRAAEEGFFRPPEPPIATGVLNTPVLNNLLVPEINEHFLFHGTKPERVEAIIAGGLDFRMSGQGMFGRGIYFAENSTKADQYTDWIWQRGKEEGRKDTKTMFLVRVTLGRLFVGPDDGTARDFTRPPCTTHGCARFDCSHVERFDSVIGGTSKHKMFREYVIYDRFQAYPEYVITYSRIH
ncbi:hypothetical protein Bbelb_381930 [Branchiostoma belcheri]|nr:hypothetical protein Bbelb_381930 [Branchiostoma belcheri]